MNTVFPVAALVSGSDAQLARPDFLGTAFSLSPGVFITAGHVAQAAQGLGRVALMGPKGGDQPMGAVAATSVQLFKDVDIAIVHADVEVTMLNRMLTTPVQLLTDLGTFGYPHALTLPAEGETPAISVVFRAYKGYVIATRSMPQLGGAGVYEISTPYPEGMSGSPLLLENGGSLNVAGVVLGNSKVHYRGGEVEVGMAVMIEHVLALRCERADCLVGQLPGVEIFGIGPHQ